MHTDIHSNSCISNKEAFSKAPKIVFQNINTSPDISKLFAKQFLFQAVQGKNLVRMLRSADLHPGQMVLCQTIEDSAGLSQRELADRIGIKPATVAIMLQKMEKSSLISRRADTLDRRISRIYITDCGKEANVAANDLLGDFLNETIGKLSPEKADAFSQTLSELLHLNNEYQRIHFREDKSDEVSSEVL